MKFFLTAASKCSYCWLAQDILTHAGHAQRLRLSRPIKVLCFNQLITLHFPIQYNQEVALGCSSSPGHQGLAPNTSHQSSASPQFISASTHVTNDTWYEDHWTDLIRRRGIPSAVYREVFKITWGSCGYLLFQKTHFSDMLCPFF